MSRAKKTREMKTPKAKIPYDPDARDKRPPTAYKSDLSNGPELALTKADHDRIVEAKGRPATQDTIGAYSGGKGGSRYE